MPEELVDNQEAVVEIPGDQGEVEVEIVDDTPPTEKQPPRKPEPESDDLDDMSERVQKRIKKLNYEKHEALRQLGVHERQRLEAIEFARSAHKHLKWESDERVKAQNAWKSEAAARREAELKFSKGEFVTAREANDPAKEADINAHIARLSTEKNEIDRWAPVNSQIPALPEFEAAQPQTPSITETDQAWLSKNQWFATEEHDDMKEFAISMESALEKKGMQRGTKECYDALDAKLRQAFPDNFSDKPAAAPKRPSSPVVGAPRTNSTRNANGKITLTASQAAIARELGISYADYYRNMDKEQ